MKKLIGRKSVLMCLVGMMVILLGATAQAALMTGGISFSGKYTLNTGNITTATGFTSFDNVVVATGSGTWASVAPGTSATFYPFTFTGTPPADVNPLWAFTSGGTEFHLNASGTTMTFLKETGDIPALDVTGRGTIFASAGFDPTAGAYKITANQGGSTFSFSASSVAIPEPGTLILLGSGLLGLALTGARKFRK